jgi:hypothetical protein
MDWRFISPARRAKLAQYHAMKERPKGCHRALNLSEINLWDGAYICGMKSDIDGLAKHCQTKF